MFQVKVKHLFINASKLSIRFRVAVEVAKKHPLIVYPIGICLLGLVVWGVVALWTISRCPEIGSRAPDFTLETVDGESVTLSDLNGKAVLLYLWSTPCVPCEYDMPHIQAFFDKWSGRDLVVLTINEGNSAAIAENFMVSKGFTVPVLLDPKSIISKRYCLDNAVPVTIFIDSDGIIRRVKTGMWDFRKHVIGQIGSILNEIEHDQVFDWIPPVVSNVSVSSVTESTAVVKWVTDEPATSQVEYGAIDAKGRNHAIVETTPLNDEFNISHSVTLTGMEPDTGYYFKVMSKDSDGNEAVLGDKTFTTLPIIVEVGRRAPDFNLKTIKDETVSLSEFRGRVVMVNFWVTSCGACVSEVPHIQSVSDKWSGEDLMILAISVRENTADVKSFVESRGLTFPVLLDSEGVVDEVYQPSLFPTTFFIDAEGILREIKEGRFHNPEEIEAILESL